MDKVILIPAIFITMSFGSLCAQDINDIFNNKLSRDALLSSQTNAMQGLMAAYGELQTNVYSFKGSFEDAASTMNAPHNANVSEVTNQSLGNSISMFLMMTENLDPKPMSDDWYKNAREKVSEFTDKMGHSLSITITSDHMQNPDGPQVGDRIEIRMITLTSPYVDLDNLKLIEGTWVVDIIATAVISQEMLDSKPEDFEEEWDEEEMDMDVDLPEEAHFVSFDDVADSELLQGDVNYVVEMSTDEVIDMYRNGEERFINSLEESEFYSQDDAVTMTTFYLLKHQGELKDGDDVVSMTILPAPKSILSDALGKNQGTWTLISISRWIEEDY